MDTSVNATDTVLNEAVKLTLDGTAMLLKLSGKGAVRCAAMLLAIAQQQHKTRGAARLATMIRAGGDLEIFSIPQSQLAQWKDAAKKYNILYTVVHDTHKTNEDSTVDLFVRAADAARINRVAERYGIGLTVEADVQSEELPEHIAGEISDGIVVDEWKERLARHQEIQAYLRQEHPTEELRAWLDHHAGIADIPTVVDALAENAADGKSLRCLTLRIGENTVFLHGYMETDGVTSKPTVKIYINGKPIEGTDYRVISVCRTFELDGAKIDGSVVAYLQALEAEVAEAARPDETDKPRIVAAYEAGEENIAIMAYADGTCRTLYGYDAETGNFTSGDLFADLEDAKKSVLARRPAAEEITTPAQEEKPAAQTIAWGITGAEIDPQQDRPEALAERVIAQNTETEPESVSDAEFSEAFGLPRPEAIGWEEAEERLEAAQQLSEAAENPTQARMPESPPFAASLHESGQHGMTREQFEREWPIAYAKTEFTEQQLAVIYRGVDSGLMPAQIDRYAQPELSAAEMEVQRSRMLPSLRGKLQKIRAAQQTSAAAPIEKAAVLVTDARSAEV